MNWIKEVRMRSLREWRVDRLLSTKKLSALAGVSNKTILDIEHGKRIPTFRTIQRLSETLDVDPKEVNEFFEAISHRSQPSQREPGGRKTLTEEGEE
jgi:transcriptional regulator with XRE-family HTH domain